ncbi:hypothetical protein MHOCP_14210 [Moorella humiferrea]|uniref:2-hydroxyglutaryl-CoA dehydratase, D-component n=2 Tax=Neomoorella humiferrea TaxID=676965 RepID=A0A2T0AVN7_9FIRM|nr:acyl-CoA dehydratase activase-related protein [Moorella humiferrea]PRR74725.1 2-hydroxyglutaryl-CoA dehydratase, D-component [Moorella humiferrea]
MGLKNKKWRLGVPRALFYYYYGSWWETFFHHLGVEIVVSPATCREIMDLGVELAVAEACLPVKVYYGHAAWLAPRVDALFVPRLVSVEDKSYICPKLMGLPDMLRAALKPCPPIIDTTVDLARRREEGLQSAIKGMAKALGMGANRVVEAVAAAKARYREQIFTPDGLKENTARQKLTVGIIGHGYLLYDRYLGMDVPEKVARMGGKVVFPEHLTEGEVEEACRQLSKRLYWTLGQKIMGAALHFMDRDDIDGIIHLTAFGCGPDSLVGDLAERYARRRGKPFLLLTLDEHTGEAGLNTRIEAFMDMLYRRRTA